MGYVAKTDIIALSIGMRKKAGARIGDDELPPKLRDDLLAMGAIEEVLSTDSGNGLNGMEDELMGIEGVDEALATALHALGFHTVVAVAMADAMALRAIPGVGPKTAQSLIEGAALRLVADEATGGEEE